MEKIIQDKSEKMESIFEEWENEPHHSKETFIKDGIVCKDTWENEPHKILCLSKEAYTKNNPKYDLRDEIKNAAPYRNWWTVSRWVYAIQEILGTDQIPEYPKFSWEEGNRLLSRIALVNIKKSNGNTLSSYRDLEDFFMNDKERLKQQIDGINPKIVLCGRVFNYYKALYPEDEIISLQDTGRCYIHRDRLIIDFWHFANRKGKEKTYYELCDLILKAKLFVQHRE